MLADGAAAGYHCLAHYPIRVTGVRVFKLFQDVHKAVDVLLGAM